MEDSVEGIDLGMNLIDDIHEGAFDNFKQLRKLRLNHNKIQINTQTDGWITSNLGRNLTLLNLAYNNLKSINNGAFDVLHNLDKLILDGNKNLQLTDNTFGPNGLRKLTMLSLDYCNLAALPDDLFKNLPKLSYLSLIGNPLTSVPKAVLSINSLHTLDLSETSFTSLSGSPFNGLDTVSRLFLKDMKYLEEIEDCGFCGLHYLNEIDISNSLKLKKISQSAFGASTNIERESLLIVDFNVENCNLTSLPEKLLNWEYVESLRLGGNPWDCVEMNWLIVDHDLHSLSGQNKPVCHTPERYETIPLQNLIDEAHGRNTYDPAIAGKLRRDKCRRSLIAVIFLGVVLIPASILLTRKCRQIQKRRIAHGFTNVNIDLLMEDEKSVVFEYEKEDHDEVYASTIQV